MSGAFTKLERDRTEIATCTRPIVNSVIPRIILLSVLAFAGVKVALAQGNAPDKPANATETPYELARCSRAGNEH